MSGEGPDVKVIKASLAKRAKYKTKRFHDIFGRFDSSNTRVPTGARARGRKRQRGEIEPAMRHSCLTLTPIDENFSGPATDSEDSTDSDMPELVDPEPLKRSESDDGLFRFHTDRMAQNRDKWAIKKTEKRRSRSTGWKHFQEPGGGHIDYSKVSAQLGNCTEKAAGRRGLAMRDRVAGLISRHFCDHSVDEHHADGSMRVLCIGR